MSHFALYDDDGRIVSIFTGNISSASLQGRYFIPCSEDISDVTHYVSGREIFSKHKMNAKHTIDALCVTITDLPPGLTLRVAGSELVTDGSSTEIEFDLPGTYAIELSGLVEYLDETLEVTVG